MDLSGVGGDIQRTLSYVCALETPRCSGPRRGPYDRAPWRGLNEEAVGGTCRLFHGKGRDSGFAGAFSAAPNQNRHVGSRPESAREQAIHLERT
jgi:hypothetical protein